MDVAHSRKTPSSTMIERAATTRFLTSSEQIALPLAALLITLCYALCWYPGPGGRVWYGDSVSFQFYAISHSLGHPPGYPQYLALTRAVASLPLGEAWQRVNFVSSLFGALGLCAHYVLGRSIGFGCSSALGASLLLALSQTFFAQASEAEVYSLHSFWVFTSLSLFVQYLGKRTHRALWTFFIVYGLSLGHHPTMVLLVLPVFITTLVRARPVFRDWHAYAAATLAIAIGLSQYLYTFKLFVDPTLTFRFSKYSEYNLATFIDFTAGSGYKAKMFSQPLAQMLRERAPHLLGIANAQNSTLFVLLGVVGLGLLRDAVAGARMLVVLSMLAFLVWALGYNVDDIHAFCTPLWALCYLGVVEAVRSILPTQYRRFALVLTLAFSAVGFRFAVLRPDYFKPDNRLLAIANEYIAAVPPDGVLVPWKVDGNSAFQALFRYLEASGDGGPVRALLTVKRCDPHVYFTDGGRKQIRLRRYGERRVGRLEKCGQDVFVMECGDLAR